MEYQYSVSVLLLQILLVDASGNSFSRDGKIIGFDPSYDLAVLKVLTQSLVAVICSSLLICNVLAYRFGFSKLVVIMYTAYRVVNLNLCICS